MGAGREDHKEPSRSQWKVVACSRATLQRFGFVPESAVSPARAKLEGTELRSAYAEAKPGTCP